MRACHKHRVQDSGPKKRGGHRGVGRRASKNRHQEMGYGYRDYAHWNRKGRISLGQPYLSLRTLLHSCEGTFFFVTAVRYGNYPTLKIQHATAPWKVKLMVHACGSRPLITRAEPDTNKGTSKRTCGPARGAQKWHSCSFNILKLP